jgi:hypothetical protein
VYKGVDGLERRSVFFFDRPGGDNTPQVIQAVRSRIKDHDVSKILVASESGRLALEFKRELPDQMVVCVTFDQEARLKYKKPHLLKKELATNGIITVDTVKEPLTRELVFRNWWERKDIVLPGQSADLFWMTLICVGGHGLRTAVEIVFMAVEAGAVRTGEKVLSVAGTAWGADSALVMKASRFEDAVGGHPLGRMKIEEILAMPRETEWSGYG